MKLKRGLIIIGCLALVGIAFIALRGMIGPSQSYPVVHKDGTVEYLLVSKGKDLIRGNEDDKHLALRFPKELRVFRPEVEKSIDIYGIKHSTTSFPPNYVIRFYFTFPDFAMQNKLVSYSNNDMLLVTMFALERIYQPKEQTRKYNVSFTRLTDPQFNRRCTKDKEIIPGLFLMKSRTEEDGKRVAEKYGYASNACISIANEKYDHLYYSVYDTLGQIQGGGFCDQSFEPICRFKFWMPQKRVVKYTFYARHLSKIHEIHATVADLLAKATDYN